MEQINEVKKEIIEKFDDVKTDLTVNVKRIDTILADQKASIEAKELDMKKQISDLQTANSEFKSQITELNQKNFVQSNLPASRNSAVLDDMFNSIDKNENYNLKSFRFDSGILKKSYLYIDPPTGVPVPPQSVQAYAYPPLRIDGLNRGNIPLNIRSLIQVIDLGLATSVSYARAIKSVEGADVQRGEGKPYKEISTSYEMAVANTVTIAAWQPASIQALRSGNQLQELINYDLPRAILKKEEQQILKGTGTGGELTGIWNLAATIATGANALQKISKAISQVRINGYIPDAIVINAALWDTIQSTTTTDGAFIFGIPSEAVPMRLYGLPVITSEALAATEFIVGSFARGIKIYQSGQVEVIIRDQHENFAILGLVAVIARETIALPIVAPQAFVKGTAA